MNDLEQNTYLNTNEPLNTNRRRLNLKNILFFLITILVIGVSIVAFFILQKTELIKQTTYPFDLYSQKIISLESSIKYPSIVFMSEDGKHVTYSGITDKGQVVVTDGEISNAYNNITHLTVDDHSGKIVFVGERLGKSFVVEDTKEGRPYDFILEGMVNDNMTVIAYIVVRANKQVLVVNNKEVYVSDTTAHTNITPVINTTSTKIAFIAQKEKEQLVVIYDLVSGEISEGKKYGSISGDPVFSSDGKYAYRVSSNNQSFIVLNGVEGTKFNIKGNVAWHPVFSPDGSSLTYALPTRIGNGTYSVVLNNERLRIHDTFSGSAYPYFSDDSKYLIYEAGNIEYTYDIAQKRYLPEKTATDKKEEFFKKIEATAQHGQLIKSFTDPSGKEFSLFAFLDQSSLTESEKESLNEATFYTFAKNRLVLPNGAEITADNISNPKFSSDGKYLTLGALRDDTIWFEVYSIGNSSAEKMTEKDGYKINTPPKSNEPAVYGTDELGDIHGTPIITEAIATFNTKTNIIMFDLEFKKRKGSEGLFVVYLDNKLIGSIYEGDAEEGLQQYGFKFQSKNPGTYPVKFYTEPLNKSARTAVTLDKVRFFNN